MSVIRVNKTSNYTVMSNFHFKDKRLSLKAKGLLSQMLSLPPEWDYTIAGLVAINQENETAIKSALKELKTCGYLVVTKKMPDETETGRIEYVYDIYEQPIDVQAVVKQKAEKQGVENLPVEVQGVENQGQLNTQELSIDDKINKNKVHTIKLEQEFEEIWKQYPKKQGKSFACKSYVKARKDGVTKEAVIEGLNRYIRYIKDTDTPDQYIKHGSTWFNQRCWDDEYKAGRTKPANSFHNMQGRDFDYDALERLASQNFLKKP